MGLRRDFDTAATTGLAPCRSAGATEGGRLSVCIGFQKTAGNAERPARRKSATGSYLGAGDAWSYPIGGSSLLGNFLISNAFLTPRGLFLHRVRSDTWWASPHGLRLGLLGLSPSAGRPSCFISHLLPPKSCDIRYSSPLAGVLCRVEAKLSGALGWNVETGRLLSSRLSSDSQAGLHNSHGNAG